MARGLWFVAGAGTGVYAMARARRIAEAFTPEGFADRVGALTLGVRLLAEDVREAAAARETELREELGLRLGQDGPASLAPRAQGPHEAPDLALVGPAVDARAC